MRKLLVVLGLLISSNSHAVLIDTFADAASASGVGPYTSPITGPGTGVYGTYDTSNNGQGTFSKWSLTSSGGNSRTTDIAGSVTRTVGVFDNTSTATLDAHFGLTSGGLSGAANNNDVFAVLYTFSNHLNFTSFGNHLQWLYSYFTGTTTNDYVRITLNTGGAGNSSPNVNTNWKTAPVENASLFPTANTQGFNSSNGTLSTGWINTVATANQSFYWSQFNIGNQNALYDVTSLLIEFKTLAFTMGKYNLASGTGGIQVTGNYCSSPYVMNLTTNSCYLPVVTCYSPQVLNTTTNTCYTPVVTCTLPQVLNTTTNSCYLPIVTCTAPQVLNATTNTCYTPVMTCTLPQVLDVPSNTCVTPVPVCVSPQVLNSETNTCVTPPPVVPNCVSPQVLNSETNTCVTPVTPPVEIPEPSYYFLLSIGYFLLRKFKNV